MMAKAGTATESLLVELLTEELPPKSLKELSEVFASKLFLELDKNRFLEDGTAVRAFATPRRLAILITKVKDRSANSEKDVPGPPVTAAPQAVAGFARKNGLAVEALKKAPGPKGEIYVAHVKTAGRSLADELASKIETALKALPIPKVMRWGAGEAQFVRPLHGLVMLHGKKVVPGEVRGLKSGSKTRGHRFMGKDTIAIAAADEYEMKLYGEGKVIVDFAARRQEIEKQLQAEAKRHKAGLGDHQNLLDEVSALVEYPLIYAGDFDLSFLDVPPECLILTMRQNQKYFPLFDATGKLLPKFLIVSNMKAADPRNIVSGNERVVRPRLEDARFFFNQDRKVRLEARAPQLASVVYHNKLGSQFDRAQRVKLLAGEIARKLGADAMLAERAAELSKADLLTGMVGEFPELQGVMGRYYALHDGEPREVADAIEQHYHPRYAGDSLPRGPVACAVALADKLDTLVGIFGIGLVPTGDKDPFALRRLALGVVRILCEHKLPLDHLELLRAAHGNYPKGLLADNHKHDDINIPNPQEVAAFVTDRARSYLRDEGYSTLEVESVLDLAPKPAEYKERLEAVRGFLKLPQAAALAESDKRIRNILSKSGGARAIQLTEASLLAEDAEKQLLSTTRLLRQKVDGLLKQEKFAEALISTAGIHSPVTRFFDEVLVNAPDEKVRVNRFALLHEVVGLTNRVANISKLAA